jgi:hypothetical protein
MDTKNLEKGIYGINEDEDYGCIVGCALADTFQEIISSLVGGYAVLYSFEKESANPDRIKIELLEKRREEIRALRKYYFSGNGHTYNDIRRWIGIYSEELKELDILRKQYENPV